MNMEKKLGQKQVDFFFCNWLCRTISQQKVAHAVEIAGFCELAENIIKIKK